MLSRSALRRFHQQTRCHLSVATQVSLSSQVISVIRSTAAFHEARHIGLYWPLTGELDLRPLLDDPLRSFYWPAVHTQDEPMAFFLEDAQYPWERDRLNIPYRKAPKPTPLEDLDLLLIPLLAVNLEGHRLGWGKGYYDRSLASCLSCLKRPRFYGVGLKSQCCAIFPSEAHDVPLDGFISEEGWIIFE